MTKEEVIKKRYPFYDENLSIKDIELCGEQVQQLMDDYAEFEVKKLKQALVISRREQLIAFLRQQNKLHYVTIYENDFEFADKLLKAINCL